MTAAELERPCVAAAQAGGQVLRELFDKPRTIALKAHTDIVIEAGPPFPKPPRFTTWGTL